MSELENPFASEDAAPVDEQKSIEQASEYVAPDAAIAVSVSDLVALVDHARRTGGDDLAARFQL